MSSRDSSVLVLGALQLIELLLIKLPKVYRTSFRREGVMFEIDLLADRELSTAAKKISDATKEEGKASETPTAEKPATESTGPASSVTSLSAGPIIARRTSSQSSVVGSFPAPKKPSVPLDPQDANILRARVIRVKTAEDASDADSEDDAAKALKEMKTLVARLNEQEAPLETLREVVSDLAKLFGSAGNAISSFELLQSGLVDGLLECAIIDGKSTLHSVCLDAYLSFIRSKS